MNPAKNDPATNGTVSGGGTVDKAATSCRASSAPVDVRELGVIDYLAAWELQKELLAKRVGGGADTLLLLEHPSVYTAGKRTLPDERPTDGIPVVDVDRGGKITWHGPGQLVGYPIVGLGAHRLDVVDFVRRLEQAMIDICDHFGVRSGRVKGRSGVWLPAAGDKPERKIGAIGLRVQQGVTEHGFAFNCDCDLKYFDTFVPCGIRDAGVTSLSVELGRDVTVAEVLPIARESVLRALDGQLPVSDRDLVKDAPQAEGIRFELATG